MMQRPIHLLELEARKKWALTVIAELVRDGRAAGWLQGELVDEALDSDHVLVSGLGETSPRSPMHLLAERLGLGEVELDVLWMLVCIELDPHVAIAAQLLVAPGMHELSAQILERLVARQDGALAADIFDRLDQLALVHVDTRLPLNRRPVRVQERVLDLARGQTAIDRRVRPFATLTDALEIRRKTAELDLELPEDLRAAVANELPTLVIATGVEGSGRKTLLRHAVSACGRAVLEIKASGLASDETVLLHQLRALARECRLHGAWPILVDADGLTDRISVIDRDLLAVVDGPAFATARESCAWSVSRPIITLPIEMPDHTEREATWRRLLPSARSEVVEACARRYAVSPGMITRSAPAATALASGPATVEVKHVHRALRAQLERRLAGTARRIETKQTWGDLVLPVDQFDLLIEMVARVRHRQQVLDDWGFADKVGRGIGLAALMSGPPGTGKTMIAGLMAKELGLDLYQVDLSKIVSKYIGETEKQLSSLFEAAESGHAILLFDEADSLFAKRTEVKSSNDRYANLEVNYLLQRIEAFSGITLLTTNHETAIDQAFLRRLAFHVRVPMPEQRQREMIWRSMLPEKAKRADDLDFASLANAFVMSGGYIKNAMLRAAFLSAAQGSAITNEQLWRAARAEYEAMGKIAFQPRAIREARDGVCEAMGAGAR